MELTHISLFAGIGCESIAAEWAGFKTILHCEIDPDCQKVLRKHWPDVPIIGDVRDVKRESVKEVLMANQYTALDSNYSNVKSLYDSGLSIQQIADQFQITRQAMWKILKRRGVVFRPKEKEGPDNPFYRTGEARHDKQVHDKTEWAIYSGELTRLPCEICGESKSQAHHDDYNKPLQVRWLCKKHHYEWHKLNLAVQKEVMPTDSNCQQVTLLTAGVP